MQWLLFSGCLFALAVLMYLMIVTILQWKLAHKNTVLPTSDAIRQAAAGVYQLDVKPPVFNYNMDKTITAQVAGITHAIHVNASLSATTIANAALAQQFGLIATPGSTGIAGSYIFAAHILEHQIHAMQADGTLKELTKIPYDTDTVQLTNAGALIALTRECAAFNKLVHVNGDGTLSFDDMIPVQILSTNALPVTAKTSSTTYVIQLKGTRKGVCSETTDYYVTAESIPSLLDFYNAVRIQQNDKDNDELKDITPHLKLSYTRDVAKATVFTVTSSSYQSCVNTNEKIHTAVYSVTYPGTNPTASYTFELMIMGKLRFQRMNTKDLLFTTDPKQMDTSVSPFVSLALVDTTDTTNMRYFGVATASTRFSQWQFVNAMLTWSDMSSATRAWGGITFYFTSSHVSDEACTPECTTVAPLPENIVAGTRSKMIGIYMWPMISFHVSSNTSIHA